jgi:hypothetical protein
MLLLKESLVQIDREIGAAAATVQADTKATPRLVAAVSAFYDRSREVVDDLPVAVRKQVQRGIVELERLGDRARAAAEADQAALPYTCRRVIAAHRWVRRLKEKAVDLQEE